MKHTASFALFIIFAFIGVPFLGSINVLEPASPGEQLLMHINLANPTGSNAEDVRVRVYSPDWGTETLAGTFDLDDFETQGIWVDLPVPSDTPPGAYLLKVSAESEEVKDWQYVSFLVR